MFYDRPKKDKPTARDMDTRAASDARADPSFIDPPEPADTKWRIFRKHGAREEQTIERDIQPKNNKPPLWWLFDSLEREQPPAPASEPPTPIAPKKKRHIILKLIALTLILCLLCAFLLYILPMNWLGGHDKTQYAAAAKLPSGYTHILLIGVDKDASDTSRSDTMLIASIGKGKVKLTTLMRDTGVTVPGRSGVHKLNSAYAYGGAALLVQTVNQNFGLDITLYALVDYDSFPRLIDALGGVDVQITAEEAEHINANMRDTYYNMYKSGERGYDEAYSMWLGNYVPLQTQTLRLDGYQALGYARIRKIDSDYGRTSRQRKLLTATLARVKQCAYNPFALIGFAKCALNELETNMNALEILALGERALLSGDISQLRLPLNGTYIDEGSTFTHIDFPANRAAFIDFVYND